MPIDRVKAANNTTYEIYIDSGHVMVGAIDMQVAPLSTPVTIVRGKLTKLQAITLASKVLETAVSLPDSPELAKLKEQAKAAAAAPRA